MLAQTIVNAVQRYQEVRENMTKSTSGNLRNKRESDEGILRLVKPIEGKTYQLLNYSVLERSWGEIWGYLIRAGFGSDPIGGMKIGDLPLFSGLFAPLCPFRYRRSRRFILSATGAGFRGWILVLDEVRGLKGSTRG